MITGDGADLFGSYAGGDIAEMVAQGFVCLAGGDTVCSSGLANSCAAIAFDVDIWCMAGSSGGNVVTRLAAASLSTLRFFLILTAI